VTRLGVLCLLVSACGEPDTRLRVEVLAEAGLTAPSSLSVSVWGEGGLIVGRRTVRGQVPGSLVILGLPHRDQTLRVAIADLASGRPMAALRVAVRAHVETQSQTTLYAQLPDSDGDGVPDDLDGCPSLPDFEQTTTCVPPDLAVSGDLAFDSGTHDLTSEDLARVDLGTASDLRPPAIERVAQYSGMASQNSGNVTVTPPGLAAAGDLVVLLIDRWYDNSPITPSVSGWTYLAAQNVDGDEQEVAWRIAAADEQTNMARYTFPASDDAPWMIFVYRHATTVAVTSTSTGNNPFTLGAVLVPTTPAVVLDLVCTDFPSTCTTGVDAGASYFGSGPWHVVEMLYNDATATAPAQSFSCSQSQAALFQLRITP
jgi:hypothetical protein